MTPGLDLPAALAAAGGVLLLALAIGAMIGAVSEEDGDE